MRHLAIIADGNRRWAASQNLPKEAGHAQGLNVIERCCEWAISRDVKMLTVYCFSTENWGRESGEVDHIMDLARWYFRERREWFVTCGIRVRFAGRRDRLAKDLVEDMETMEEETKQGDALTLTICADYGGRDAITRAVQHGARTEQELDVALTGEVPTPDAILRTGGEMRLSNFLLWQAAYAELFFSRTFFPALEDAELDEVLNEHGERKRNYGT
ncbi:MAG: polyprenyl diphosphate synthase [Oscillibacter sp.]